MKFYIAVEEMRSTVVEARSKEEAEEVVKNDLYEECKQEMCL